MSADGTETVVSVLIPTLNEERHVDAAVAMVRSQVLEGVGEFLFIDGRSTDRTRALLTQAAEADPRIRVLDNPARFIPNALNIGLAEARGEFVARMDAHTRYPADYLQQGIDRLRRGDVAWVSGPQLAVGAGRWSRRIALALGTPLGIGGASFRRLPESELETDTGFTGVWRRETLLAQSGWDERWQVNEDSELAWRIRSGGGRIVCLPEMAASYIPRESLSALARQYRRYGQFRALTCLAHPESMRRSHLIPPLNTLALAAAAAPFGGRLRRLARLVSGAYAAGLLVTAVSAARTSEVRDAAWIPAVLATMHTAWGVGFLSTCARRGVPVRGAIAAIRRRQPPG